MKKFLPLLLLLSLAIQTTAQAPQAFKYQAVARDMNGNPVISQEIAVKISILSGSPDGTVLYSEIHEITTTSLGLINLEIGNGTVVSGSFQAIAWGNNACFIKTEMDTSGGDNFVFLGTSQLLSVPYSLFSDNGVPDGQNPGDMLYWNGTQWIEVGAGQNGQFLIFSNGVPTWGGVHLPILNTSAVTNITAFTAYSGGNIASDGGSPIVGRGICWNTSPNPTTSNNKVFAGSGAGNFLAQMTGLESSTLYFVRAFATNSAGTSYGQEMTFYTTAGNITLSTTAITDITTSTATSGGNIVLNGGSPVTARGVCWNTAPYPTLANNKTTDGSGNGIFVSQLTSLAPNTQYYIRAYATNSLGTSYGNQLTFTTLSGIVTLTTAEVTGITFNSAISGGEITSDGGSPVTVRGVCWNTLPNPTIANNLTTDGEGTGFFVSILTGLLEDTTYYVRAYATNAFGTYYGEEMSFETLENLPPLAPNSPQPENGSIDVSIDQILSWSCSDPDNNSLTYDVFFGTENPPTQVAIGVADTFFTPGTLNYNTTYYWKIVAGDDHGNGTEGDIWSFTTFEDIGCPESFIDSRDGKSYSVVQIGNQCWMAENLNIGTKIDGSQNQQNNEVIEKYCYNNLESNCDIYGGLYQWNEAMTYSTIQGVKGICPIGWHVPTDNEWCTLEQVVDPIITCSSILFRGVDGGGKLKEAGTTHWSSPNTGATNSSGFTALPGGIRVTDGSFGSLSGGGYWWSSSEYSASFVWYRHLSKGTALVARGDYYKSGGLSVRCIRDDEASNQPPNSTLNPLPETGSINITVDTSLYWSCTDPDGDPLTYDVFFGLENPPAQVATAITDTFYTPGTLNYNTAYYWKIVANDDNGNSTEGEVWSFTTMDEPWQCGDSFIDDRDGQEYNTVQIGTQCWMAENLNVGTRINGINGQSNNGTIEKYCYGNAETNCDVYGGLYQWDELMAYTITPGGKGICPSDWHVPTDSEWCILEQFVDWTITCGSINERGIDGGGKLKETGTLHWNSPNSGATNSSGFTARGGGLRFEDGTISYLTSYGYWWSSTEYSSSRVWSRALSYNHSKITRDDDDKDLGFSVRCLKD